MKIKMQEDQTPDFILRELPEVPPIKCWACGKAIYGKYIVLDGGIDQGVIMILAFIVIDVN